jgi:hypothetical protein
MDKKYYKDSGMLNASKSKKNADSPDYWGEICINVEDMTKVTLTPDGYYVFPLSGWKKISKAGNTFLAISIKRKDYGGVTQPSDDGNKAAPKDDMDDDIPF